MTIGLIGAGIWGKNIIRELINLAVDIKIFDPNPEAKKDYPHFFVDSLTDLQTVDGIVLASPSVTHRSILEEIVPWGIPVFIEKPLVTSLEDAIALKKFENYPLFMMHIWRYHSGVQLLGQLVRNKELGDITALYTHRCNWTSPRTDTNSIWNLAPHDLTIALEILGYIPAPRSAVIEWHGANARGMTALLGHAPFVQIEVSNRFADKRREIRLHGTQGIAILADEKVDYIEVFYGDQSSYPTPSNSEKRFFETTPPLRKELEAFLAYLRGGTPPISTFQEGITTIEILTALYTLGATTC